MSTLRKPSYSTSPDAAEAPSSSEAVAPAGDSTTPVIAAPGKLTRMDALVVFSILILSANYSVIKASLDVLPPYVFNSLRFTIATITLAIVTKAFGEKLILPSREWLPIIAVALLGNVVYQTFYLTGLHNSPVAHSVLITTTAPIGLVVLNILRGKDLGHRNVWIGVGLALSGIFVVIVARYGGILDFSSTTMYGDAMTIVSAFVWVINTLLIRGPLVRNSTLTVSFWMLVWGSFFTYLLALPDMAQFHLTVLRPEVIRGILFSGVISVGGASTVWNLAIRRMGTSRAAIYMNLQPIFAALIAAALLGEVLTIWVFVGIALVLLGMAFVRRS